MLEKRLLGKKWSTLRSVGLQGNVLKYMKAIPHKDGFINRLAYNEKFILGINLHYKTSLQPALDHFYLTMIISIKYVTVMN